MTTATTTNPPDLLNDPHIAHINQKIIEAAGLPLEKSITLPAAAYTSPQYFQYETEQIFKKEWLCLAHISQLPNPGDYLNIDILGEPLIVVHSKDRQIRILSRVCPHRAMDIMPEQFDHPQRGNKRIFLCPYHHWTFELDGTLKGSPEMQHAQGFCRTDFALAEFRCQIWEGFIFVNFSADASPLQQRFAELTAHLGRWNMADMHVVIELQWDCHFNWKVMVENWMESYHHMGIHYKTLQPMMPAKDTWTEPEKSHFIRSHLPFKAKLAEQIQQAEAQGKQHDGFLTVPGLTTQDKIEWGLHLGYPFFMLLTARDRVIWYRLQPLAPNHCKLLTTTLVHKENLQHPQWERMLKEETKMLADFHSEDMEVCSAVQNGFSSQYFNRGRLSHLEMPVWLIQRYCAARAQNTWPTSNN